MRHLFATAVLSLAFANAALAAPNGPAEKSLDTCQNAVRTEGARYAQRMHRAIAGCLTAVSTEVVRKNEPGIDGATQTCGLAFGALSRTDPQSIRGKFTARIAAKCDPARVQHTLDDLLGGAGAGAAEPLSAGNLSALCGRLGGDGAIGSFDEWFDCVRSAQDCAVRFAIASEFPRAIEWLNALSSKISWAPAHAAVVELEKALDGPDDDDIVEAACPPAAPTSTPTPTPTPTLIPPTITPSTPCITPFGFPVHEEIGDEIDGDCDGHEACLRDFDGDGVSSSSGLVLISDDLDCRDPGEATKYQPFGDCCDSDPGVKPGQTVEFTTVPNGCNYFDYDCKVGEERQFGVVPVGSGSCSRTSPPCGKTHVGFQPPLPACGATGTYQDCDLTTCTTITTSRVQGCR